MRITLSLKKGNPHSSLIILLNFLIYIPSFPCLHARGRAITFDYYNAYILAIIVPFPIFGVMNLIYESIVLPQNRCCNCR